MNIRIVTKTIGRKLIVGFGVMLLLVFLAGAIGNNSINSINTTVENALNVEFEISSLASEANVAMLSAQRQEKDYLLRYSILGLEEARAQYVDSWTIYTGNLDSNLNNIIILEHQRGHTEDADLVEGLLYHVDAYEIGFQAVVDLTEQRGVVGEGLLGDSFNALDELEESLVDIGDNELTQIFSEIRENQTFYLLERDEQNVTQVEDLVIEFKESISNLRLHSDDIETMQDLADNYLAIFSALVAKDAQIAEQTQTYRTAVNNMETVLEQIVSEGEEIVTQASDNISRQKESASNALFLAVGLAIAIGGILTWVVTRSITAPLSQVVSATEKIAAGDLSQRAEITSQDEIGSMARAFNTMAENLEDMVENERESKNYLENTVANYTDFVQHVADGDLTTLLQLDTERQQRAEDDDNLYRLGMNLNTMIQGLTRLIHSTQETATSVAEASQKISVTAELSARSTQQIASAIQQIAEGTSQQTEQVTGATSIIDQVSQAIDGVAKGAQEQAATIGQSVSFAAIISEATQQVAANAQSGADSSAQATETARSGAETVRKTLEGMENILEKVGLSAEKVRQMGKHSDHIGAIVETIDGIASQTNLLALNATIEAARAGEHGKGFAVVADEVRKLAEKSASATQEIANLIKAVQLTVGETMQAMDEGTAEVEIGVVRASESGKILDDILNTSNSVNQQMIEIAVAAEQMTGSVNEMVDTMDTISAIVEENTAATEEMAASADEVSQAFESMASISEENSAATQEVGFAIGEVTTQTQEVSISSMTLQEMAADLQAMIISNFRISKDETLGNNLEEF
jgi:methyl-accepting chemotaxis protein